MVSKCVGYDFTVVIKLLIWQPGVCFLLQLKFVFLSFNYTVQGSMEFELIFRNTFTYKY